MPDYEAVIVGSGVNSLACAALVARAEWRVCVLERNDWFGGAIKTEELTEPGFLHDTFSAWHPLWVGGAAHAELGEELAARGLEYLNAELPTATAFPDGGAAFLVRTAEETRRSSGRSGPGCSSGSYPTPTSRSASSAPSSGRPPGSRSPRRRCAASVARARSPSSARSCNPAATGSRRPSPPSARTGCSRPGCCTPASAPTRRRPASWRR